MSHFTPFSALIGGLLIGLSASILLLFNGRIAGISGILGGIVIPKPGDVAWRAWFLAGLVAGGIAALRLWPGAFAEAPPASWAAIVLAGLFVGFGTRLSNGCTSGHGVCGISRLSRRSIVATMTFMATGAITVLVVHHLGGGAR
ncbi:Putative transmembrane protein [Minicystis rosea]|nr:Putative transmembrane protein [Minicystis rosea]